MKRSTKIWLIVAGCLFGAGLLFFTIGAAMGGINTVMDWALNGELNFVSSWNGSIKFDKDQAVYEGSVQKTLIPNGAAADKLFVRAGSCEVRIRTSEDGKCYFSSENAYQFQCYVEGGTLQLRVKSRSSSGGKTRIVTLYLPEEMNLAEVSVRVGAGRTDVQGLCADKVSIDIEAGKAEISELTARRLSIDVSAGRAAVRNAVVQEAEFDASAGTLDFEGIITGGLEADCSAGTINIALTGKETDHNYDVDCSAGTVRIGDTSYGGIGKEKYIDNGSASEFELDCSAGKIIVSFR